MAIRNTLSAIAIALAPGLAVAEPLPLSVIADYFENLSTAETTFEQVNPDGSVDNGTLKIRRPGRMRFEYDAPNNSLVIAGGQRVAIFDAKSNTLPEQYPLKRTPLNLILGRKKRLDQSEELSVRLSELVDPNSKQTYTVVSMSDPETPEAGTISLRFGSDPLEFKGWIIETQTGDKIEVRLAPLETGMKFPARAFNIVQEIQARGLDN